MPGPPGKKRELQRIEENEPSKGYPMNNDLAAAAAPFLQRIEEIDGELAAERGAFAAKCRTLRSNRKDVFGDAKDVGIAVKALKAVVKRRELESRIAGLPSDFDIDESAQFKALVEVFAGTPFGEHVKEQAAKARAKKTQTEERPDKISRGHDLDALDSPF
jgi:uncharacterized protein (UPF0335 family)